jgi:hypothetical protein
MELTKRATVGVVTWVFFQEEIDLAFQAKKNSDRSGTLLSNRLGYSETYSLSLELEISIAIAVETTSTLLSSQIVRNPNIPFIFHSDFDNLKSSQPTCSK